MSVWGAAHARTHRRRGAHANVSENIARDSPTCWEGAGGCESCERASELSAGLNNTLSQQRVNGCCQRDALWSFCALSLVSIRVLSTLAKQPANKWSSARVCILGPGIKVGAALSARLTLLDVMSLSHTRARALEAARAQNCVPQPYFGNCLFNNWIIWCWGVRPVCVCWSKWPDCQLCVPASQRPIQAADTIVLMQRRWAANWL